MKRHIIENQLNRYVYGGAGYFYTLVMVFMIFFSCHKIAVDRTEVRTNAISEKFRDLLTSSPHGWNVCVVNKEGMHYNFYMQFNKEGRVKMKADFDKTSLTFRESDYQIKLLQSPTLSFSTYNYISALSDPDLGPRGRGLMTDFEYAFTVDFTKVLQATLEVGSLERFSLRGILYQSDITFVRAEETQKYLVDSIIALQDKILALKWKDSATVPIFILSGAATEYHYDFRPQEKLFGVTSLEDAKRGAPLNYYFSICDKRTPLVMHFNRNTQKKRALFSDPGLLTAFEQRIFGNFAFSSDSTELTFSYWDEGNGQAKTGKMTTKNVKKIAESKCITADQRKLFAQRNNSRRNRGLEFVDIKEDGKVWDFSQGGKLIYRYPSPIYTFGNRNDTLFLHTIWVVGTKQAIFPLMLYIPKVSPTWWHNDNRIVFYLYLNSPRNIVDTEFQKWTDADSLTYFPTATLDNLEKKLEVYSGKNISYLLSTVFGFQVHNPDSKLYVTYDLF